MYPDLNVADVLQDEVVNTPALNNEDERDTVEMTEIRSPTHIIESPKSPSFVKEEISLFSSCISEEEEDLNSSSWFPVFVCSIVYLT